jgi:hypothetical protein
MERFEVMKTKLLTSYLWRGQGEGVVREQGLANG